MGRNGIIPSRRTRLNSIVSPIVWSKNFGVMAFLAIGVILFAFVGGDAVAQTATGTITGTVSDKTGAMVPGVTIRLRNEATNAHRQAISGDDGLYRVPVLPPGSYEIRAEMPGFKALVNNGVSLSGQISDSITVTDLASEIDTQDSQLSSLVDSRRIESMPLNGRNVFVLATLQPGVVPAMSSIANAGGPNSEAFMSAGTRHRGNNFTLDGQSNNHDGLSALSTHRALTSERALRLFSTDSIWVSNRPIVLALAAFLSSSFFPVILRMVGSTDRRWASLTSS